MAWSSYAHLPTTQEEYYYILNNLENDMSVKEVDSIIATYKNKTTVQHHYRSNLVRLGLFNIEDKHIVLNYNKGSLAKNKNYIIEILRNTLKIDTSPELTEIAQIIKEINSYDLQEISDVIIRKYTLLEKKNLIRWIRPIVYLIKLIDTSTKMSTKQLTKASTLQQAFLNTKTLYGSVVPIELLESKLKIISPNTNIIKLIDSLLDISEFKYKIELIMMPSWATDNKSYKLGNDFYTHLKLKSNLLKEDNREEDNCTE